MSNVSAGQRSIVDELGARLAAPEEFGREALVACDAVVRIFRSGGVEVQALQGLDLLVHAGEMVAVVGASGSGKSTLLRILAAADAPSAGRVRVGRWDLGALSARDRVTYRRTDREARRVAAGEVLPGALVASAAGAAVGCVVVPAVLGPLGLSAGPGAVAWPAAVLPVVAGLGTGLLVLQLEHARRRTHRLGEVLRTAA